MTKIKDLKKELDSLVRKNLLHKAKKTKRGYIKCPLTNKYLLPEYLDVCHYIDRKWLGTRWDLDNCVLCSRSSNQYESQLKSEGFKSLHHERFELYLGKEKIAELESKKNKTFSLLELIELKDCLTKKLES